MSFSLGALVAGFAGGFYAHQALFIDANQFDFSRSAVTFLYVVLGGVSNPLGPLLGAAIVTLLPELLRVAQDWRMTVFGTMLIAHRDLASGRPASRTASAQVMTALLQVDAVSRRFGGYLALNSASCEIAAGQVHALIGPNGAGKTTLFNIISGFLRPTSGRIAFKGHDYTGHRPDKILAMGIARNFQQVRLVRGLSVVENVMIGAHARMDRGLLGNMAEFCGSAAAERRARDNARSMLDFVGVSGKAGCSPMISRSSISAAWRLRARWQAIRELLLLDEPAAGMNPTELGELGALIGRIQAQGVTILLVEHHMQLVMAIANCITVLSAGNVIADGPPHVIQRDPAVISAYLGSGDEPAVRS